MRGVWLTLKLTLISQDSASLRVSCENEEGAKGLVSKTRTNDGCCVLEFEERDGTLLTQIFSRQFVLCCRVLEGLSNPLQRGETTVFSPGLKTRISTPLGLRRTRAVSSGGWVLFWSVWAVAEATYTSLLMDDPETGGRSYYSVSLKSHFQRCNFEASTTDGGYSSCSA